MPPQLREAITAFHRQHAARPPIEQGSVAPCDVRVASVAGVRALVVVTHQLRRPQHIWHWHLAHSDVDLATDHDAVLAAGQVTDYPLVICGELYGMSFEAEFDRLVARVDRCVLEAVRGAVSSDGETVAHLNRALPLAGTDDPRRRFMHCLLATATSLSERARRWAAAELEVSPG